MTRKVKKEKSSWRRKRLSKTKEKNLKDKLVKDDDLREIFKLMIGPIVSMRPWNRDSLDFLEESFCVNDRKIVCFETINAFSMPGERWWPLLNHKSYRYHNREVKRKSTVWVRKDKTQDYFTLELEDGRCFQLNDKQFKDIRRNLHEKNN